VKMVSLLNFNQECVLVLELEKNGDRGLIDNFILDYGIDRVCVVDRIPLDKRHNSKIDYPTLINKVNKIYKTQI